MTDPDLKRALLFARLAAGVYDTALNDLSDVAASNGLNFVAAVEAPGFQAMIVVNPATGEQIVVFRGTPVTCGRDIEDAIVALGYDLGQSHTAVPGGGKVLTGPFQALQSQWNSIAAHLDLTKPVAFTGHSLGGATALLGAAMVARTTPVSVIAFAPFQVANGAFWLGLYGSGSRPLPLIIGRAADFALGWNHADPVTRHPSSILHLADGKTEWLTNWPWTDESVPDHDVADYVKDLEGLAAAVAS